MAIRAFLCTWSVNSNAVTNPISTYLDSSGETRNVELITYSPGSTVEGVPDKPRILVLVRSNEIPANEIEMLGNLPGVYLIPSYRFTKPISEIPLAIRVAIRDRLVLEGIPLSALSGIDTWGDFLAKVAKYFNVNFSGFGKSITDKDEEFS